MSSFDDVVDYILAREDGLTQDQSDPGGITNFGISLRFLREVPEDRLRRYGIFDLVNENTVRDLTVDQAKLIYKGEFWDDAPFFKIESQRLCNYCFDMAVNCGVSQAIKLLQRSISAASFHRSLVRDDGILGELTIGYCNSLGEELLPILVASREAYYHCLIIGNPKLIANLEGWLNRTYRVL